MLRWRGVRICPTVRSRPNSSDGGRTWHDPLWSARVLLEQPALIASVHDAYFAAGADVAITATYQASFEGFARRGLTRQQAAGVMQQAVAIACDARDRFWQGNDHRVVGRARPLVVASVGPYGAFLADGSEYRGDYALTEDELRRWHDARFTVLAQSGADLLACETIPSGAEARALLTLLEQHPGVQAWFSFTARDGTHIANGEPFAGLAEELGAHPQVVAVGINCTAPEHVASLLRAARQATSARLVVYPNSGETYLPIDRRWVRSGSCGTLVDGAREWLEAGATLIGGCCRTTPDDIRALEQWGGARAAT
ncbi:MAG: homocysteine S-methyltransferase [Gemmatimonadaceae bacterium]|nr:homocysteine S-methyltransferase [Gemmatimonadaceae bacterium]